MSSSCAPAHELFQAGARACRAERKSDGLTSFRFFHGYTCAGGAARAGAAFPCNTRRWNFLRVPCSHLSEVRLCRHSQLPQSSSSERFSSPLRPMISGTPSFRTRGCGASTHWLFFPFFFLKAV